MKRRIYSFNVEMECTLWTHSYHGFTHDCILPVFILFRVICTLLFQHSGGQHLQTRVRRPTCRREGGGYCRSSGDAVCIRPPGCVVSASIPGGDPTVSYGQLPTHLYFHYYWSTYCEHPVRNIYIARFILKNAGSLMCERAWP